MRSTRFSWSGVVLLLLLACNEPAEEPDGTQGPVLRLNHLQVKGTHNSYHLASPVPVPLWQFSHLPLDRQLDEQGVRQVELDLNWEIDPKQPLGGYYGVYHAFEIDQGSTCPRFVDCLQAMKGWSDAHPGHVPLFVWIEPKDDPLAIDLPASHTRLEAEILSIWPRSRLFVPDDLQGNAPTLAAGLAEHGWPRLDEVRGRAIFVMLDSAGHRQAYSQGGTSVAGRLLFVTAGPGEPLAAITRYDNPLDKGSAIAAAAGQGLIIRTRADDAPIAEIDDDKQLQAALASGAHLISTDFPGPVQGYPYSVDLPGGAPVRCNPVTAPPGCRAEDLEDLP